MRNKIKLLTGLLENIRTDFMYGRNRHFNQIFNIPNESIDFPLNTAFSQRKEKASLNKQTWLSLIDFTFTCTLMKTI